jgi:hypothetical protein
MGLVTAVSIQLGSTHQSPNILQLMLSILKIIDWISKTIFWYVAKYLMCLNGSVHAIYRLTHTIVLMYLILCTHVQSKAIQLTTPFSFGYVMNY